MKRLLLLISVCILSVMLFCACGEKQVELIISETPNPQLEAVTPVPTAAAAYNSIDQADETATEAVSAQLMNMALACQDIYASADKGTAINVVLSSETVRAMVNKIGETGCSVVDADGSMDMQYPQPLINFGEMLFTGEDTQASYYSVYGDGQISVYNLTRRSGQWYLTAMSALWDKNNTPRLSAEGRYAVSDVKYTDKGWLIYARDTASFDANQKSNTMSYVFVRVQPYDSTMRSLCQKYVLPVGYFENNLFTTDWNESNLTPIDFNSLYSQLFGMYNGTVALSARNESNYYSPLQNSSIFIVPSSTFEKTVQYYFDIDATTLKAISDYSSAAGGYMFLGYRDGYYNVTPRTPEPEVVDYHYNGDGTLTMRVDAVNRWYGTDKAFTHDLTVRIFDDGRFNYVSNEFYESDTNILPERRLSYLLNIEREKTDY